MNVLALVFSLMLILAIGFYSRGDKCMSHRMLRNTYESYAKVARGMSNQSTSAYYNDVNGKRAVPPTGKKKDKQSEAKNEPKEIKINPPCSRINLCKLMDGNEQLYEVALITLRTLFNSILPEREDENKILDAMIEAIKKKESDACLESLCLGDEQLQNTYYLMLKGAKEYPTLLNYFKIEQSSSNLCCKHMSEEFLSIFFGKTIAEAMFAKIHNKKRTTPSQALVENVAKQQHQEVNAAYFALFSWACPDGGRNQTIACQDAQGGVALRKDLKLNHTVERL